MGPDMQEQRRWCAVRDRDASMRGFFYGVLTTGIYCLPGCPSPTPQRKNLVFFDDIAAARVAGFRPCRRCLPDTRGLPAWFENAGRSLARPGATVASVAANAGVSRSTLHRTFMAVLGVTPSLFRQAAASHRLRTALDGADSVIDACFAAGFRTASTAYANSLVHLGLAPGAFRSRGVGLRLWWAAGKSSLGHMVAATTERGLCLLEFLEREDSAEERVRACFPRADIRVADPEQAQCLAMAIAAVDVPERADAVAIDIQGTAFQQRVWAALRNLKWGERISYSALAGRIGQPKATRAVARAVADNTLAVLVPCHRVLGKNGKLTGYRWNLQRKAALLAREACESGEP